MVNYKDLTKAQIEYIRHIYYSERSHKEKTDILGDKFGISERSVRRWWAKLDLNKISSDLPPQLQIAEKRNLRKNTKVLLVTTAQNKTCINKDFLKNLEAYRDFIGDSAEIVVIPSRYRNPTSNTDDDAQSDWWDEDVQDYLFYGKVELGDTLISADSRISPTASEPLNGYELLANKGHLILGHSRQHLRVIPRLRIEPLRIMCTTGYATVKNYSKSKAGNIGFAHHSTGFVIVEEGLVPRVVKATDDGDFTDIVYEVSSGQVNKINKSLGFVLGDIHARQLNKDFFKITMDWSKKLNPEIHVCHDVFDGSTVNPHEAKDMFTQRLKIAQGKHLIEDEVEEALNVIEEIKGCCSNVKVVEANHDLFLQRHIDNESWKKDLHNSPAYLKYALIQQTVDLREYGNIFGYLIHERFKGEVEYVKMGDSLRIGSYECGQHGDFGSNGAKGNIKSFSRLNVKLIHGHVHSPAMHNNVTAVGVTANLHQHYNRKGFSSWAYAHSVIHENGKNQLLIFTDDYKLTNI